MLRKLRSGMCYSYFWISCCSCYLSFNLRQELVFYAVCSIWAKMNKPAIRNYVKLGRTVISTWTRRRNLRNTSWLSLLSFTVFLIDIIARLYYFVIFTLAYLQNESSWNLYRQQRLLLFFIFRNRWVSTNNCSRWFANAVFFCRIGK